MTVPALSLPLSLLISPDIVRRAVGLGRYLQNRLALTACLFGPEREVLSARMHPAQDLLGADEVYASLERSMVSVTNQVRGRGGRGEEVEGEEGRERGKKRGEERERG